ncbi:MAG: pyridoxamine 5'-phosphate oxidase family protein [Saprospiraceae bacterium]|nr:pyridoxamine 5'-phosphate oxidase family protein [Saprospiraceae bacterium]
MPKPTPKSIAPAEIPVVARMLVANVKFPMLATIEGTQPRLRPVSPVHTDGFTIYIGNLKSYDKTAQIDNNPKVELCYLDEHHNQVRITGMAIIEKNRKILEDIWKSNQLLQLYLGSLDNPELIVYRIEPISVRFMQEWALKYHEIPLE